MLCLFLLDNHFLTVPVSCVLANYFLAVSNIDATLQRVVVGAYKATVEGVELTLNFGL